MNETHAMNMTGGEIMMHPGKEDMEPKASKESEETSRSRRGIADDVESAGKEALTKVETAGKGAIDTAKNLGKEGNLGLATKSKVIQKHFRNGKS